MKKLLILLICSFFLISIVSAADWDNVVDYKNNDMTVVITNWLGFGEKLGEATLTSHKTLTEVRSVFIGKDRVVMYYNFNFTKEYKNGLGKVTFIDENTGKKIDKEYYFAKAIYSYENVTDYNTICYDGETLENKTIEKECVSNVIGSHIIKKVKKWERLENNDIPSGESTIALITDVQNGDYTDGIWKISGKSVLKHASWSADLSDGLISYYTFDEGTGTIAGDIYGGYNGTSTTFPIWNTTDSMNGTSLTWNGTANNQYISVADPLLIDTATRMTINVWVKKDADGAIFFKTDTATNNGHSLSIAGTGKVQAYFWIAGSGRGGQSAGTIGADWTMVTVSYNGTGVSIYINGEKNVSFAHTGDLADTSLYDSIIGNRNCGGSWCLPFDGELDELAFWNIALTDAQISTLYDSGTGTFISDSPPSVSLNTPLNSYNSTSSSISINCTSVDYSLVENISLYFNNVLNKTVIGPLKKLELYSSLTLTDGKYNWTCSATDDDNNLVWASSNRTFLVDSSTPTLSITYPLNNEKIIIDYTKVNNLSFTFNWTVYDSNGLGLCKIWNGTGNNTISCSGNTSYMNLTYGYYQFILWANDTYGNENSVSSNFTAEYIIFENSISYDPYSFDLITSNITANVTYNSSLYTNILGYLYYNGTPYLSTKSTEGSNYLFKRGISIPGVYSIENKSFLFNFIVTNSTGSPFNLNTSEYQQQISPTYLVLCNTTYSNSTINFTFWDEVKQEIINGTKNATTIEVTFDYWINSINANKSYSYQNISSSFNSYQFCIYPPNVTFKANMNMIYSASGFFENNYYLKNASLNNVQNDILLYLLNTNTGTKFYLTFQKGISLITYAIVNIQKYFVGEGTYKTVAIKFTDSSGEAPMYMDLDAKYQYTIVKDGELMGIVEKVSACSTAPCSLTIYISEAIGSAYSSYEEYYAGNILSNISYNKTSKIVTYTFVDITGLANYFNLVVREVKLNQTGDILCDSYSYSTAGTLSCNLTGENGDFVATGYISRSPPKVDKVLGFVIEEDVIEGLGLMGIFLIMCLIITIVFAAASLSRGDPSTVLIFFGISIILIKLMGIFPFSWVVVVSIEFLVGIIYLKIKP